MAQDICFTLPLSYRRTRGERVQHFEIPQHVQDTATPGMLDQLTAEVILHINGLQSVEKEEAVGDFCNLVLLLEGERGQCVRNASHCWAYQRPARWVYDRMESSR